MAANLTPERRPDSDLGSNVKPRKSSVSFNVKAELLQLILTPIICLMNFINKKVGNRKN